MFFTTDPTPTEMASMLIGALCDCQGELSGGLAAFAGEIVDRYRDAGSFAGFSGDAVMLCEDAATCLQMIAAQGACESRELASLNLMAYAEAQTSSGWVSAGAENADIWDSSDLYATGW